MEKFKQFIQKYINYIIIGLIIIIFLQACGSCSKKTNHQFKEAELTEKITQKDSIINQKNHTIDSLKVNIITLQDSIKMLTGKYEQSQTYIQGLQDDKKLMRDIIRNQK